LFGEKSQNCEDFVVEINKTITEKVLSIPCSYVTGNHPPDSWSGSERDLAVPSKRRRQDDDVFSLRNLQTEEPQIIRRSASLIAFESLEKRCEEDTFRLLPLHLPPVDAGALSDVDADAEDEDDSESSASDDALMQSLSSRGSFR